MPADLSNLASSVSSAISSVESDFLSSLDHSFLSWIAKSVNTDYAIDDIRDFRNEIDTTIASVGDLNSLLENSITAIESIKLPDRPSELDDPIENDLSHVFISNMLDNVSSSFESLYSTASPNSGLNIAGNTTLDLIQKASYLVGYEKEKDLTSIEVDNLAIAWSADGYELPPDTLAFDIAQLLQKFSDQQDSKTSSVASYLMQTIESNMQSAFENGIDIEKLHSDFTKKFNNFKYDKLNAIIQSYVGIINGVVKEINAPNNILQTAIKAIKSDIDVSVHDKKIELEQVIADVGAWASARGVKISADTNLMVENAKIITNALDGYLALFNTYGAMYTGVITEEQQEEEG